jgi:hypothetical protein
MSAMPKRAAPAPTYVSGQDGPWAFEIVERPKGRAQDEAVFQHIRAALELVAELPENKALKFDLRSDDSYSTVRRHFLQVAQVLGMEIMVGHRGRTVYVYRKRAPGESGVAVVDLAPGGKPARGRTGKR